MAEKWRYSETGINGKQFDTTHDDLKNLKRVDESWPEDEFGAKLSLGANFGYLLKSVMGPGDIELMGNAEPIDPPAPGTAAFGARARQRRRRLQERKETRPEAPEDVLVTDVVSGEKQSLTKKRREKEDYLDF